MEPSVEIRYAGVVVGHATQVRDRDAEHLFVVIPDPLPVGSMVEVALEGGMQSARVESIVESTDATASGMRLRLLGAAAPARPAAAAPAAEAPGAVPAETSGVVEAAEDAPSGVVEPAEDAPSGLVETEAEGAGGQSGQPQGGGRRKRRRRR